MIIIHNKLRIVVCTEYYKHYCKIEDGRGDLLSGNRTRNLVVLFFWQVFWLHFSSISSALVYWLSGGMYAQVLRIVVVAFLVVWVEPDQQPVLHLPKQLCPTAWITTLRYPCPRVLMVFNFLLFYYKQKWVSSVKSKMEAAVVDKRNISIDADSWL